MTLGWRTLFAAFVGVLIAMSAASPAPAATGEVVRTDNVASQFVAAEQAFAPGRTVTIALRKEIRDKWHTYWRNAGDAGEPTRFTWDLPPGVTVSDVIWPIPKTITLEDVITNYGYEGELFLPLQVTLADTVQPGQDLTLRANVTWLVCETICIPEEVDLELTMPVLAGNPAPSRWDARLIEEVERSPVPAGLDAALSRAGDGSVVLTVAGEALASRIAEGGLRNVHFYPFDGDRIDHNAPQPLTLGEVGLSMGLTPAFGLRDSLQPTGGIVAFETRVNGSWDRQAIEITAVETTPPNIGAVAAAAGGASMDRNFFSGGGGLIGLMIGAFLGGLILNLMPCVFPVLFIKALGFVERAHDHPGEVRKHGLFFLGGVMATFTLFAVALAGLQAAGQAVGWGFQLQSPLFVFAMALLFTLIALNLFGLFEIGTSLQGVGSGLAEKQGSAGAFFTGVLAVVVASPCTAPFMAGALGYALNQPIHISVITLLALGLGLAFPFVLLSFFPRLLEALPKPGPWMETLKQFFAFPMLLTAAWLLWVLSGQAGPDGAFLALAALTLVGLAFWAFSRTRGGSGVGKLIGRGLTAIIAVAALGLVGVQLSTAAPAQAGAPVGMIAETGTWSPETVASLRAEGRPVFVDFTAKWCITCQFNKRNALVSARVQEAFVERDVVFLTADWTNRDDIIAAELERHGRSGVPLYLLYGVDDEPAILPQLLTPDIVIQALDRVVPQNGIG